MTHCQPDPHPVMVDVGVSLSRALQAHVQRRRARTRTVIGCCAAVIAVGVPVAAAVPGSDHPTAAQVAREHDQAVAATSDRAAPLPVLTHEQATRFAALTVAPSTTPKDFAEQVSTSILGAINALNPSLARSVGDSARTFLVPGREALCLWITDPTDGGGMRCATTERVAAGQLVGEMYGHGRSLRVGIVPDGVHKVTLSKRDGTTRQVPVVDNAWTSTERGLTSATIAVDGGSVIVPLTD